MKKRIECHAIYGMGGAAIGSGITALDATMDAVSPIWDCSLWEYKEAIAKLAGQIIARRDRYRDEPVVILIDHSAGCMAAHQVGWALNAAKRGPVAVDYNAAIDPTALLWFGLKFLRMGPPMVVSPNVRKVDEFHATSGVCYRTRRADPSGQSGGRYIYPAGWTGEGGRPITVPGGHVPCASAKITRDRIVESVRKIVGAAA